MSTAANNRLLRDLFNALPKTAEGGVYQAQWYVNRSPDEQHDPVASLCQYIEWEENGSYLFSGLRGAGKTTELNRLQHELRQNNIQAYYCDAGRYLNLNDPKLSMPELLMTVLAGLADAVRQEFGQDCLHDSIWERTKRLLNAEVRLKPKVSMPLGGAGEKIDVEATLQENPDFRKKLIEFAKLSSEFYREAEEFAQILVQVIRQQTKPDKKIVLLVDSLERVSAPTGEEAVLFDSLKEVFFNDPKRLQFPNLSVVYSAPPYLHAVLPGVSAGFSRVVSLPNFKVSQRPTVEGNAAKNPDGLALMQHVLAQRFPRWQAVLTPPVLEHLAWLSGGNVRRFFSLLRTVAQKAALGKADLPLTATDAPTIRQAISEEAQPLQWLIGSDRLWLKRFMRSSDNPSAHIEDLSKDLPSIIRLFDHSLVLDYQNGSVWYQVPQLVRECIKDV